MNKKLLYITIGTIWWFITSHSYAQALLLNSSHNYLNVNTYDGATDFDAYNLKIIYHGTNLDIPNWKLSVKLRGPILSSGGIEFPSQKISFIPVRTESGNVGGEPNPVPAVNQIGMPSPVFLNGLSEVFLVPGANVPLYLSSINNKSYDLRMIFNLTVAGGSYLSGFQALWWPTVRSGVYTVPLQFTAYRNDNTIIGVFDHNYTINIHTLTGTPPEEDQYSIRVSTEASNGLLEFSTMADYVNGKSVTYTGGLSVSATTAYQVTVRSVSFHFSSAPGNTLPLDIVRLQLGGGSGNTYTRALSTDTQTILEGSSTGGTPVNFDITYSTEANDSRLFNVPSDHYTTSLMYEISPR